MSKSMIARFRRINDTVPYALNFQPLWPSFLLDNLVSPPPALNDMSSSRASGRTCWSREQQTP